MSMSEIKQMNADSIIPVIMNLLKEEGKGVRITVTGNSMYPFLRDKKDSIVLYRTSMDKVRAGDIILTRMKEGEYVLHRVFLKRKQEIYLLGDAQKKMEGPIYSNQILAKAEEIIRNEKVLSVNSPTYKILSLIWTFVIPFRSIIMKCYRRFRTCQIALKSFVAR